MQIYKREWTRLKSQIIFVLEWTQPSCEEREWVQCFNCAPFTFAAAHSFFWCQRLRSWSLQTKYMWAQGSSLWHSSIRWKWETSWIGIGSEQGASDSAAEEYYKLGCNENLLQLCSWTQSGHDTMKSLCSCVPGFNCTEAWSSIALHLQFTFEKS